MRKNAKTITGLPRRRGFTRRDFLARTLRDAPVVEATMSWDLPGFNPIRRFEP